MSGHGVMVCVGMLTTSHTSKESRISCKKRAKYGPLPQQSIWRPASSQPLKEKEEMAVCVFVGVFLLMSVCFNVLKGIFMFSCVWVCVVKCCHMEPVLDCPESVCVCVCFSRNCTLSISYFISSVLNID